MVEHSRCICMSYFFFSCVVQLLILGGGENLLNGKIIDTQGVVVCLSDISSKMTFCPEMFFIFLPLTEEQLQRAALWR